MTKARRSAIRPAASDKLRIIYVGRLTASKNIDTVVLAVSELTKQGYAVECTIIGEGPHQPALEALCAKRGLNGIVHFTGGMPFDSVLDHLEKAEVLVLVSETEGWPKAIAEGMAFGLICVGTNRGLVPELLADGRGFTVPPADVDSLVTVLQKVADDPDSFTEMRRRAAQWGQQFSLELLSERLRELLVRRWQVELSSSGESHGRKLPGILA
jgi:glycosyltransferase involved in cell wall biosynthesis